MWPLLTSQWVRSALLEACDYIKDSILLIKTGSRRPKIRCKWSTNQGARHSVAAHTFSGSFVWHHCNFIMQTARLPVTMMWFKHPSMLSWWIHLPYKNTMLPLQPGKLIKNTTQELFISQTKSRQLTKYKFKKFHLCKIYSLKKYLQEHKHISTFRLSSLDTNFQFLPFAVN
jgi:hypothetical protein